MKIRRLLACQFWLCLLTLFLVARNSSAQSYTITGTNQPGTTTDIPITLVPGSTNLSVSVAGSGAAYSHLLLKAGATPNDLDYDFGAAQNGTTNAINLEAPEFKLTNYVVRVRTPLSSATHSFTLTVATNATDVRTATRPATKSLITTNQGTLTAPAWQYYRVDIATNLTGWRVQLASISTSPDLYIQRDALPTTTGYLKRSQSTTNDDLAFAGGELTPGTYYIGVFQPSGTSSYTLRSELISFTTLTWDPGITHLGTQAYASPTTNGGDYYFKITTQNTSVGAWRTALNVTSGEASIYLAKGTPPAVNSSLYKSERSGSDGFVVPSSAFNAGEDWYYLVHAEPGAQWNLVSGEPFVTDLGVVAADGSSGSGTISMGAEGMRFFQTTMPPDAVAWRLWLNGSTNTIFVKKTGVPLTGSTDLTQARQMLVVPSYLVGGQLYFVGVNGAPGANLNLDSRLQTFTDISFASSTSLTVTGYNYTTFRVQVPADQLGWQMSVVVSNGNPNLAVRRNFIPNENNNDAYSEVASNVTDSITLVPPTLSDGTFYITIYSTNDYACTLQSGTPEFTEIDFNSVTTNTDTNRVGWRFFKLSNISQQLGALGWDLFVTNFAPGTRIALRRNAAPGIWNFRNPNPGVTGSYDYLSTADFLQRPGHQADVWYVGVYNTNTALGNFTLITRELTADPLPFDTGAASRFAVPPGKWQFFRVDVPNDVLGWDVRVLNVLTGAPQIVIRRELLPISLLNIGFSLPITLTNWPSGNQWAAAADWSSRNLSPDGTQNETGRVITMGYQRPLESATYYIGVTCPATATNEMSYTLVSRGIGTNQSIPVQELNYFASAATNTSLAARDIAVYHVSIASNTPSWKVRLAVTGGDALLAVAKDHVPNITALANGSTTNALTAGKKMNKLGNEHFVQLPINGSSVLFPGDYYLVVASEGLIGTNATRIGTDFAGYELQSIGPLPELNLGLLDTNDLVYVGTLEGGESAAFHFANYPWPTTLGFELSLEDRTGNPVMVSRGDISLADPGASSTSSGIVAADPYGNDGGQGTALQASGGLITVADPFDIETIMIKARTLTGAYPDAAYRLRVRKLVPVNLAFDGGFIGITAHTNTYDYFKIEVPTNAVGWDLRLTNVTSGAPLLIASRDALALNATTPGWNPAINNYWPSFGRWIAAKDWTQRTFAPDGVSNEDGRLLAMGMERPLEPGTYYIGVHNDNYPQPMSYFIESRGIGGPYSIPVVDLPFAGGGVTVSNLLPREAAYYRVIMPPNATSWRAKLTMLEGEGMLVMMTNAAPSVLSGRQSNPGKLMQKVGDEQFVMLPVSPDVYLSPGTNYFAVISEGMVTTNVPARIGTNASSFTIQSFGELAPLNLGVVGTTNLVVTNSLEAGEVRAYQFTVPEGLTSLETSLQNVTGNPAMVLRVGSQFPNPGAATIGGGPGAVALDDYGNFGGYPIAALTGNANTNLISVANPSNGVYTVMVKARAAGTTISNATYTLTIRATTYLPVTFDGGAAVVTNHTAGTWRYYRVDVPTNALGWDIRLANVTAGLPKLVVARDVLPSALTTATWGSPGITANWPSTNRWGASLDWTRRTTSADGLIVEDDRILAMGVGQPLEAGTYYIGVINDSGAVNMSYTLLSRGIGENLSLPVNDLAFTGGSLTISNLAPREAAYFRVEVPTNAPSWKIKLAPTVGEAMLVVLSNHVPNVDSGRLSGALNGKFMQKAGNEHYLLLPLVGQTNIIPGTYYLAAVSEGVNPASATRIGSGNTTFTVTSVGNTSVNDLGTIGATDILITNTLEGGESQMYQFNIPANAPAIEMRLENRVGNPVMVVLTNTTLPDPGGLSNPKDLYGNEGGATPSGIHTNILTIANPTNGTYTLAVKARALGTAYPDASFTLRIRQMPVPELNFTGSLDTNGLGHSASDILVDGQRAYFKVVIPESIGGSAVLGWQLDLAQTSGQAGMRVRKDLLPSDTVTGMPFVPNAAIIAPPVLTNGTWYVEVRGTNTTSFTLTSSAVALQRPIWQMPGSGEPTTTPGLTAPDFGDSGVETNGVALAGDQGIDLELGRYHYYAVKVPTNNAGLLRVQLEGISGNPDFYLRTGLVPTASHGTNGLAGTMYERSLTGAATEYGNFVPLNGKTELRLTPGIYYLAVRAVANSAARYRLKLSTGLIQDLALNGGAVNDQFMAANDWRYFRVQIPLDTPTNWQVSFSQISGDVVLYLRDTVPPGNSATTNTTDIKDWTSDAKNSGPYGNFDLPATYTFSVPPVRPDSTYYLGIRAKNDAIFSLSSITTGFTNTAPPIIPFYGGSVTNVIPPNGQVAYRIITPADALRWRNTSSHSNTVQLYLENGTYPTKTAADDYRSTAANSTQDRFLTAYPWLPVQTYYLTVTNTTSLPQNFTFTMNGSSTNADDDLDGMLDAWEIQYFGSLAATAIGDSDSDGVSNLNEFLEGTHPSDKTSFRPRLTVLATNGVVTVNPTATSYAQGDLVTLTATPNVGYQFVSWGGQASGTTNQIDLLMNTNKTVVPRFRVPGDDFDQRIQLTGGLVTYTGLQNSGATKESGEPNHAGNAGGKSLWWTWTAPASGPATVTTAGSNFRNALAAYTGPTLTNLTIVATNLAGVGTNTSQISFAAVAGTTYHFAVDGFNGTNGNVVLNLSLPNASIALSQPFKAGDGLFHFLITSAPGAVLRVDATTNLTTWTTIATVTNVTGTLDFADPNSPSFKQRFYRVVLPTATPQSLVLANSLRLTNGQFQFNVIGPVSQVLRIEATTNQAFTGWSTLATLTNTSGTNLFTDTTAPAYPRRFYRAVSP